MAGPITKLLDVDATGPLHVPDEIMDAGTLSVIDFLDPYTWPGEVLASSVSAVAEYKQFDFSAADFNGQPVKFDYAFPATGGAINFDGTKDRNLILPDSWKLDTGMKHFALCFWLKMTSTIPSGSNNLIASFITDGGVTQWNIVPNGDGSNVINNLFIYFRRGATSWALSSVSGLNLANDIFNNAVHQLTFEYLEDSSGTSFVILFYLDGQLVATSTAFPTTGGNPFVAKATAGKAKIGCPSGYTGKTFAGDFRRAWFQNAELSDRPVIDLVKLDWDVNKKRMGAA